MTHRRPAGSPDAVLIETLSLLTDEAIQRSTGKSRGHFYVVAQPTNSRGLYLTDAAALDAALVEAGHPPAFGPLMAAMTEAHAAAAPPPVDLARALRRLAVEQGDLNRAVDEAMSDDRLTARERAAIAREAQDLMETARAIRDHAQGDGGRVGAGILRQAQDEDERASDVVRSIAQAGGRA